LVKGDKKNNIYHLEKGWRWSWAKTGISGW